MANTLELTLLGTGSPVPSPSRWGNSQVIVGGQTKLMVDCGWGATRRLFATPGLQLRPSTIDALFITHLHSDHISDIVDLLVMRWTGGARQPLSVYGPTGTREMVDGARAVLKEDTKFRLAHHGEKLWANGTECAVHEFSAGDDPVEVATIGDITVKAFAVDHRPVFPAYGYRFERDGRSIVISGDTNPCLGLLNGSRDADLLVCDSMHVPMMEKFEEGLRTMGNVGGAALLLDAHTYHAPIEEAAALAQEAGVKHFVLSHLMPPIENEGAAAEAFRAAAASAFSGQVTVGYDLMRLVVE